MADNATRFFVETISGRNGSGTVTIGSALPAAGTNRPTYSASATALAAMAPENPAMNEVHPVRNAVSGPNASRR